VLEANATVTRGALRDDQNIDWVGGYNVIALLEEGATV